MYKIKNKDKLSNRLSFVLQEIRDMQYEYDYSFNKVNELDQLTQDYLHKLELVHLSTNEKSKVATALRKCRKERREYKEEVETLEEFIKFVEDKQCDIKNLERILGNIRKKENVQKCRTYTPRVISEDEFWINNNNIING